MPDTTLMSETILFAGLDDDALAKVVEAGRDLEMRRGDLLFREGDDPDELFVVVSGRIAIANKSIDGRESMVALMEEGDLFGEMGIFLPLIHLRRCRRTSPRSAPRTPHH